LYLYIALQFDAESKAQRGLSLHESKFQHSSSILHLANEKSLVEKVWGEFKNPRLEVLLSLLARYLIHEVKLQLRVSFVEELEIVMRQNFSRNSFKLFCAQPESWPGMGYRGPRGCLGPDTPQYQGARP
jgi:hypothetical protein